MKKFTPIKIVIIIMLVFGSYKFVSHIYERHVANQMYSQMEQIDGTLDNLQKQAIQLRAEKESNIEIMQAFNALTDKNYDIAKAGFIKLIYNINYDNQVESPLLQLATNTTSATFKLHRNQIKEQVKQLRANYNQKIIDFTEQIKNLTNEVQQLNDKTSSLSSGDLRDLEAARLKFLSEKISATVTDLKGSFLEELLDDVIKRDTINEQEN